MINSVNIVGRLTRDPELRVPQNNVSVVNGNIAVNRSFKGKDGERGADFINFVAFNKTAEIINQYAAKGAQVGFTGRIQTRNYQDKEDRTIYVTEVIVETVALLESKGSNNGAQPQNNNYDPTPNQRQNEQAQGGYGNNQGNQQQESNPFKGDQEITDDMLPF